MKPYLLDVNVLLALAWTNHVHHSAAQTWFAKRGAQGFRTCPITETGFVRISSNPAFTPAAVTPSAALALLERVANMPGYGFWPDDVSLLEGPRPVAVLAGHRQVVDWYLLALAASHGGVLATFDRGAAGLAKVTRLALELIE